jgi:hypothetical protein
VPIAMVARQGEITHVVRAIMLLCPDVLDVESRKRKGRLREAAILATIHRPFTDAVSCIGIHQG